MRKKDKLVKEGRTIYNLSVGTPDFKPPKHIMDAVTEAVQDTDNYKYPLLGYASDADAVVSYYKDRCGVTISSDEITGVHGTQEGMGHLRNGSM